MIPQPILFLLVWLGASLSNASFTEGEATQHNNNNSPPLPTTTAAPPEMTQLLSNNNRLLNVQNRHQLFYVLYLCVLVLCCLAPCSYYLRLYFWQRQRLRRLEELERAGLVAALHRTMASTDHADATLEAVREERRARIVQLMESVRKKLLDEDFREVEISSNVTPDEQRFDDSENLKANNVVSKVKIAIGSPEDDDDTAVLEVDDDDNDDDDDDDGEKLQIRVPSNCGKEKERWVPGQCTICLCRYRPGMTVAWSSNPSCDHVFHAECIETWLMRHEDPVCPCCRRDFLVDPFDAAEEKHEFLESTSRQRRGEVLQQENSAADVELEEAVFDESAASSMEQGADAAVDTQSDSEPSNDEANV